MSVCDRLRVILDRFANGEAAPDESLVAARHLAECTACRIRQARARWLAEILEREMSDPVAVDDEFVDRIMRALPATPPRRDRRAALRLVRLGAVAALALLPMRHIGFLERNADFCRQEGLPATASSLRLFAGAESSIPAPAQLLGLVVDGVPQLARMPWALDLLPLLALAFGVIGLLVVGSSVAGFALSRLSDA